jgi:hypothetical protein
VITDPRAARLLGVAQRRPRLGDRHCADVRPAACQQHEHIVSHLIHLRKDLKDPVFFCKGKSSIHSGTSLRLSGQDG